MIGQALWRTTATICFCLLIPRFVAAQSTNSFIVTLFSKDYVRSTGQPENFLDTFIWPSDMPGLFKLTILNGDHAGDHRVSSGTVKLNGSEIIRSSDFSEKLATIERAISLLPTNTLVVELTSKPNSFFKVLVTGVISWPAINDSILGVSLNYPPAWTIQRDSRINRISLSNVQHLSPISETSLSTEALLEVRLRTGANPQQLAIQQWFDQFFAKGFSVSPLSRFNTTIDGRPAVRIETSEIGRTVHFYVALNADIIEVAYSLSNVQFLSDYQAVLSSIRFNR